MSVTEQAEDRDDPEAETTRMAPLEHAVGSTVTRLQAHFLGQRGQSEQAAARAVLAKLRRSAGQKAESHPLALEQVLETLDPPLVLEELGKGDAPSASERSAFHALTLFALHMQGAATPGQHIRRVSFANACGRLHGKTGSESMKPRFDALLLSRSSTSRLVHIRSMVSLLRSHSLGFDYGAFARDLRTLDFPRRRNGVLLRWGRDFAMAPYQTAAKDNAAS